MFTNHLKTQNYDICLVRKYVKHRYHTINIKTKTYGIKLTLEPNVEGMQLTIGPNINVTQLTSKPFTCSILFVMTPLVKR